MGPEMESYYCRHNIRPISLGPGTPWPNRAEAAIRMFKKQVSLMLISLTDDPLLANITYKQLLRQACISRNTMVTHGGVTPIELAFGRRPADITAIELMNPAQLTTEAPAPERQIEALRSLAMRKFLEAKQSDLRTDIASKLQLSDGPFFPGDKVYYWTEDKSKIKSDGSHGGKWIKGKLVSVDGSMVGVDLGTRIVKVNISKIRQDHDPIEDVDVPLDPAALASAELSAKDACTATAKSTCRTDDFANMIMQHDASQTGPAGIQYGHYVWEPIAVGRIDFLEMFSGSAKLSQSAAMQGLRVGAPIDLRTGYDLLTAEGRRRAMEVIERQQPKIIHMAPVCGPWSQMQNIHDPSDTYQKRKKYLPHGRILCQSRSISD